MLGRRLSKALAAITTHYIGAILSVNYFLVSSGDSIRRGTGVPVRDGRSGTLQGASVG
jgi:hypothetical protein